jgi:hypothetical protein
MVRVRAHCERGFPYGEDDKWGTSKGSNGGGGVERDKWGAIRGEVKGAAAIKGGGGGASHRRHQQDDENSLVGAWDVGSSKYASSIPDSDVQSVYSKFSAADERFLPTVGLYKLNAVDL